MLLTDSDQSLLYPNIRSDVSHIVCRHIGHWRHVTEFPVMCSAAVADRDLKRRIAVV